MKNKGFTLVELMIAMTLVGVISITANKYFNKNKGEMYENPSDAQGRTDLHVSDD